MKRWADVEATSTQEGYSGLIHDYINTQVGHTNTQMCARAHTHPYIPLQVFLASSDEVPPNPEPRAPGMPATDPGPSNSS